MSLQKRFVVTTKSPLRWRFILSMAAMSIVGFLQLSSCIAAPLNIAQQGKSTYAIVVPKLAVISVTDAAVEMQRDIAEATGAKLPIVKDDDATNGSFISLGATKQAQQAGAVMETLYNKLDENWWSDFFRSPVSTGYNLSEVMFRNTFGAHYPEMEKLFLEAWNQLMTEKQKQRLDLIRQNMIALQCRLRNAGYLPVGYKSPLAENAKQVFALFTDDATKDNFSYIFVANSGGAVTPTKIELGQATSAADKIAPVPNSNKLLLYPTRDGVITLKPYDVLPGSNFLSYYLQDAQGKTFQRGFLSADDEITFAAKAGQPYYLSTRDRGLAEKWSAQAKWKISIPGAAAATASFSGGVLYLQGDENKQSAPIYVYAPSGSTIQTENNADGAVVQTGSDAKASSKAARGLRDAAKKALADVQKRYQADMVQDLDGRWQFITDPQKTGDANGYEKPDFDDSSWKTISTIGSWQDHGFPEYHGTAWYRKTFNLSSEQTDLRAMGDKQLLLYFGAIDGDAVIYLNGKKLQIALCSSTTSAGKTRWLLTSVAPCMLGKTQSS